MQRVCVCVWLRPAALVWEGGSRWTQNVPEHTHLRGGGGLFPSSGPREIPRGETQAGAPQPLEAASRSGGPRRAGSVGVPASPGDPLPGRSCRPLPRTPGPRAEPGRAVPKAVSPPQHGGSDGSQGQKLRPRPAPPPLQGPWEAFLGPGSPGRGADDDKASSREAAGALPDAARNPRRRRKTQNPTPLSPRAHIPPTPPTLGGQPRGQPGEEGWLCPGKQAESCPQATPAGAAVAGCPGETFDLKISRSGSASVQAGVPGAAAPAGPPTPSRYSSVASRAVSSPPGRCPVATLRAREPREPSTARPLLPWFPAMAAGTRGCHLRQGRWDTSVTTAHLPFWT